MSNNARSRAASLLRTAKASWRANFSTDLSLSALSNYSISRPGRCRCRAPPTRPPPTSSSLPTPHKQKPLVSFFRRSAAYRRYIVERSPWMDEGRMEEERREETTSIPDSRFGKHDATRFPRFSRLTTIDGDWPRVA